MNDTWKLVKAGKQAGSIQVLKEPVGWFLHSLKITPGHNRDEIITGLFELAIEKAPDEIELGLILLDSGDRDFFDAVRRIATAQFSFRNEQVKRLFTRILDAIPEEAWKKETALFSYQDLETLGFEFFVKVLLQIQSDSLDFYAAQAVKDPQKELMELKDPDRYIPHLWQTAFFADKPVGMILPGKAGDEGVIQFMGVLPSHRGRGYGSILHCKALLLLKACGLKQYVGSTDSNNLPMVRIFEKSCKADCCQYIYRRVVELT
jgi:ribosomal protein S18 acetylase RimI-like enzyme